MTKFALVLLLGAFLVSFGYSQTKSDKDCCSSSGTTKTSSLKVCDDSEGVSMSALEDENSIASIQSDDKNKKIEKNTINVEKNVKIDKSKSKSSDDGCCGTDKKKVEKTKPPKS